MDPTESLDSAGS